MKKYSFIRRIFFAFKQTEKPENWLLQKIKENPFQFLWSLSLTCGGFFLFFFFLQMGFMPDINFSEVSGILIASALIGGQLIVLFTALLMAPIIFVLNIEDWKKWARDRLKQENKDYNLFSIILDVLSILLLTYYLFSPFKDILQNLCSSFTHNPFNRISLIIIIAAPVAAHLIPIILCKRKNLSYAPDDFLEFLFLFSLIFFLAIVFYMFTYGLQIPKKELIPTLAAFVLIMYLQRIIAYIVINSPNDINIERYIIAAILVGILFLLTGAITRFSRGAVFLLGLGERQVSVLLKKEGCDIFNAISKSTGEGEICKDNSVDSIYLKSRIASPYVFERHKNNEMLWRITIPKEYVVSLIFQKQNSGQSIGSQSSDSSAQNNQLPDSSSPNKTPAQTSPAKCLTTCCMCCVPAASCHIPPNCPSKAKQESESRAQPC